VKTPSSSTVNVSCRCLPCSRIDGRACALAFSFAADQAIFRRFVIEQPIASYHVQGGDCGVGPNQSTHCEGPGFHPTVSMTSVSPS